MSFSPRFTEAGASIVAVWAPTWAEALQPARARHSARVVIICFMVPPYPGPFCKTWNRMGSDPCIRSTAGAPEQQHGELHGVARRNAFDGRHGLHGHVISADSHGSPPDSRLSTTSGPHHSVHSVFSGR